MSLIKKGDAKKNAPPAEPSASPKKEESNPLIIKGARLLSELRKEGLAGKGEVSLTQTIIKKGSALYEPIPISYDEKAQPESPLLKSGEPSQIPDVLDVYAKQNAEEELKKIREEAQRTVAGAKDESAQILADAQGKAKKLIEQSKLYCETAHANAEREGFAEGKEKAHQAALEELKEVMFSAREMLEQVRHLHEDLARKMEPGLARLAVKIAEKVIAHEVSVNHDVVLNMVRSHLEKVKERERVIIHVNPEDYEFVRHKKGTFEQLVPGVRSLEIQPDQRVERGSCMVETDLGTVDANITTQLEAINLAFSQSPDGPIEEEPNVEN